MDETYALILLSRCKGIGPVHAKMAINMFGSANEVFNQSGIKLHQKCNWTSLQVEQVLSAQHSFGNSIIRDLQYMRDNNIKAIPFYDNRYPMRLKQIVDAPLLLYYKGEAPLNPSRTLAVVGTRKPSSHSLYLTQKLIEDAQSYGVQIISGLAYGIDICAHRGALKKGLSTLGILAHGLDQIYPKAHKTTSEEMLEKGGLLSEMPLFAKLHPDLFPRRNRIIAGMSDAVVVVESKLIGGSMSTAQIARSYDREVFAFPGNPSQGHNSGCNALIKRQVAELIEDFSDVVKAMNWQNSNLKKEFKQSDLFPNLSEDEITLLNTMTGKTLHIDELLQFSGLPLHRITLALLELEIKGVIKVLPGKYYQRLS